MEVDAGSRGTKRKEVQDVPKQGSSTRQRKGSASEKRSPGAPGTGGQSKLHAEQHLEFGGPLGAAAVMIFSHSMPFFMLLSLNRHNGFVFMPSQADWDWLIQHAAPTREAVYLYLVFLASQVFLGYVAPGVVVNGNQLENKFDVIEEKDSVTQRTVLRKNKLQIKYLCNSFAAWWISLAALFWLQYSGTYDLGRVYEIHGPLLSVAMIFSDLLSLLVYLLAYRFQVTEQMIGNFVYDMFMGAVLNPRVALADLFAVKTWRMVFLGSHVKPDTQTSRSYAVGDESLTVPSANVREIKPADPASSSRVSLQPGEVVVVPPGTNADLKLLGEIKMSWLILFTLVLGAFFKERSVLGYTSNGMWLIMLAQGLYSNACMKGEHLVPTTWDITFEKWGWMLIFWNLAGVPFVYCFQSFFIAYKSIASNGALDLSTTVATGLGVLLIAMYVMWDNSNHQKNTLRMWQRGDFLMRMTFPQFPPYRLWDAVPGVSPQAMRRNAENREKARAKWEKVCLGWLFHLLTRTDYDWGAIVKDDYARVIVPAVYDTQGKKIFVTDPRTGQATSPKTTDLLCDGWHKHLRKPHYVSDFVMTIIWGSSTLGCGATFLPFFYPIFFGGMIVHRWTRDEKHLAIKYREAYTKTYKERVPSVFIPGIC